MKRLGLASETFENEDDPVPREEKTTGQADREHDHGNKLAWL